MVMHIILCYYSHVTKYMDLYEHGQSLSWFVNETFQKLCTN